MTVSKSEFVPVEMDDQWRFVGGRWEQDQDGLIIPPATLADENLAFYTAHAYGDFEAEFEFRWETAVTTAAFVFRAQDACHYCVVDFPTVGQQCRAEHFWATVSKVDQRGYREGLHMQTVPGVSSATGLWHQARIRVQGDEIRVWVDGRPVRAVRDASVAGPGRIGLATYCGAGESATSCYRNLRISGEALDAPPWDEGLRPARNWGVVDPGHGEGSSYIVRAANGDLLVMSDGKISGADARWSWRSSDNGQTWTGGELSAELAGGWLRAAPDGRLEMVWISEDPPFRVQRAESKDHGKTWSARRDVWEVSFPPEMPFAYTSMGVAGLLDTKDGALLLFASARVNMEGGSFPSYYEGRWHHVSLPGANYCLRSTDGGQTWSEPVKMDGPPHADGFPQILKEVCEICAAETHDGKILALIRPVVSPTVWEAWSHDGGRTWKPMSRGSFPMYASGMISTTSGALIIGGRFPGIAVQVSRDDGMTWNFDQVDTAGMANAAMFEIEPDVVLFTYAGRFFPASLRFQIMRLTPTGMEPVKVPRFDQKLELDSVADLALETTWRFKTDPQKVGTGERWFAPDVPDSDWAPIRTDRDWRPQGYENYHGSAWYRTGLTLPQDFDTRKHLWLFFESVDSEAYVYVDGTQVFEHTWASSGLGKEIWDTPFGIDARPLLKPGSEHLIAVRVDSEVAAGGIWRPVSLISTDSEAPPELLREILRERRLQ